MDEHGALEAYFRARAQTAAEKLLPGVPFEIRVTAQGWDSATPVPTGDPAKAGEAQRERNFNLRVALRTETDLNEENRTLLRDAIGQALALAPERGDVLRFETGPLGVAGSPQWSGSAPVVEAATNRHSKAGDAGSQGGESSLFGQWVNGWTLGLLSVLVCAAILLRRRKAQLDEAEQAAFADLLAGQLAAAEGQHRG
jgi:flagellar M-ring protein FliF